MDGNFVDPAAFRLRRHAKNLTGFEDGLSVNWVEFFQKADPSQATVNTCEILRANGRTVGINSGFALLNVGALKTAAARYVQVAVVQDEIPPSEGKPGDSSHSLVTGYESKNEEVAEEIHKVIIHMYPAAPVKPAKTF